MWNLEEHGYKPEYDNEEDFTKPWYIMLPLAIALLPIVLFKIALELWKYRGK